MSDAAQFIAVNENPGPVSGAAGVLSDANCSGCFDRPGTRASDNSGSTHSVLRKVSGNLEAALKHSQHQPPESSRHRFEQPAEPSVKRCFTEGIPDML